MPVVDFSSWVVPDLVIPLGEARYTVRPPSVDGLKIIVDLAVVAEHRLGVVEGDVPPEVQARVDALGTTPIGEVSLGPDVHAQMIADGVHPETIRRTAVFAVHYWARGLVRAEYIARALWALDDAETDDEPEGDDPKA